MNPKIIAFVDENYIPVAQNWLLGVRALGLEEQVVLVTLDEKARDAFPPGRVLHRPLERVELADLWRHRIIVFQEFLAANQSFIHSDVDAVWLRDPLPYIKDAGTDAVFSQGTVWPPDVHKLHRLVLCCGFFYLAATDRMRSFLDAVAERVLTDGDDQISVNRVVSEMIDTWRIDDPYEIPFRNTSFLASKMIIFGNLKSGPPAAPVIAVLPHHVFPRLVEKITPEMSVVHPFSGKTCDEKRICLSELGIWSAEVD